MAQIQMTVPDLTDLIGELRVGLKPYFADRIERIEANVAERAHAIKRAESRYDLPDKLLMEAASGAYETLKSQCRWWEKPPSFDEVYEKVVQEYDHKKRMARLDVMRDWHDPIEDDRISPVLDYLEALCKRVDPNSTLLLSDHETFHIMRAKALVSRDMEALVMKDPNA